MTTPYSEQFLEFWGAYPRHVGKAAAWRAFQKVDVGTVSLDVMLEAVTWQARQPSWREQGGRFVPHPATWLNGRRWEDEPFEPIFRAAYQWNCPHTPVCEASHYCRLKVAKAEAGL